MKCTLNRVIYPKRNAESSSGYTVIEYLAEENGVLDGEKILKGCSFTVVGNFLPVAPMKYEIDGKWKEGKYGRQLSVNTIKEVEADSIESILAFLSSGLVKGVGEKTAKLIVDEFNLNSLKVIEEEPEKLEKIKGITDKKAKIISESYKEHKESSEIVGYLTPLGISPNKIMKIFSKYKNDSMDVVKNHPFKMCEIPGIGFTLASTIAEKSGAALDSDERCQAGLMYILSQNEIAGNLYMNLLDWLQAAYKLLNCRTITSEQLRNCAKKLIESQKVKFTKSPIDNERVVYRMKTAMAEHTTATAIMKMVNNKLKVDYDVSEAVDEYEEKKGFSLAPEQRGAVERALESRFSVITGGPGTGKTTIIDCIYNTYHKKNPDKIILMCAPTGCASRRITDHTGISAHTLHSALGLTPKEDESDFNTQVVLNVDLLIVDEFSMVDMFLAASMMDSIPKDAQVVLIGDVDQLPSVGPGAVLSEIINSKCVPVSRLTKIYRQKNNSKVALNAQLIKNGNEELQYDDKSFAFIEANTLEEAAQKVKETYMTEFALNGVDNVTILSPFKRKTIACSNEFNKSVHDLVNKPSRYKKECIINGITYREGDKVMQTKNVDKVSNGDIGYITRIDLSKRMVEVDFGSQKVEYEMSNFDMIEHAYSISVHKSQGSEYEVVILDILDAHTIMLWRNLLYTGVTRAKRKVIIIGQKSAVLSAIRNSTDKNKRKTLLAERLKAAR